MRTTKRGAGATLLNIGVWAALLLALAGSLRHVAWSFSTLEGGDLVSGFVQATAIDLGLCVLALGIQQRRRQRRGTMILWAGVGMFSLISIYANLLYGLVHQQHIEAGPLAGWRPFILSAVLPILVLYLSEVAGGDANFNAEARERAERQEAKRLSGVESTGGFPMPVEQAREIRAAQQQHDKEKVLASMLNIWRDDPQVGISAIARRVGVSRTTAYTYRGELEQAGAIARDNGTVKVLV